MDIEEVEKRVHFQLHGDFLDGIHILTVPGKVGSRMVKLKLVPWSVRANRSTDSRWVVSCHWVKRIRRMSFLAIKYPGFEISNLLTAEARSDRLR